MNEPVTFTLRGTTITLYCGDCLEVLPTLGKVDAVITDPPYGIGFAHGGGGGCLAKSTRFAKQAIIGDNRPFDPSPWVVHPIVVLWGGNHFASRLPDRAQWLVWDKRDGITSNDQADCEVAWTNQTAPARLMHHMWNGMIRASERGEPRVHPTQKPVPLMSWCMDQTKVPIPATVLDPYMGSGTTGIACIRTGRSFIGIEKDPVHFQTALKRIERELEQSLL